MEKCSKCGASAPFYSQNCPSCGTLFRNRLTLKRLIIFFLAALLLSIPGFLLGKNMKSRTNTMIERPKIENINK